MTMGQHGNEASEHDDSTQEDNPDEIISDTSQNEGGKIPNASQTPEATQTPSNVNTWKPGSSCLGVFVVLVLAALFSTPYFQSTLSLPHSKQSIDLDRKIQNYFSLWKNSYPNQNKDTWSTIMGQLWDFASLDNVSPLVIVMAYDEAYKTTNILASEVSRAALNLRNNPDVCGDADAAKIYGSKYKVKGDYLLNEFLPQIKKCSKMIIINLEKLDGSAAEYLHSMVDPDHPIIPKFVYIFTVKISNIEENVYSEVRKVLISSWNTTISDNWLNALLSRLTNNVLIIGEPQLET